MAPSSTDGGPEAGMTLACRASLDSAAGKLPDRTSGTCQTGGLWGNGAEFSAAHDASRPAGRRATGTFRSSPAGSGTTARN